MYIKCCYSTVNRYIGLSHIIWGRGEGSFLAAGKFHGLHIYYFIEFALRVTCSFCLIAYPEINYHFEDTGLALQKIWSLLILTDCLPCLGLCYLQKDSAFTKIDVHLLCLGCPAANLYSHFRCPVFYWQK